MQLKVNGLRNPHKNGFQIGWILFNFGYNITPTQVSFLITTLIILISACGTNSQNTH